MSEVEQWGHEAVGVLFNLCKRYYAIGRYEDAETIAFQLRMVEPLNVENYKLSGAIQAKMERHDRAFNCYKQGLVLAPYDPELWLGLGQCAIYMDNIAEAMTYLDTAIVNSEEGTHVKTTARKLKNIVQ